MGNCTEYHSPEIVLEGLDGSGKSARGKLLAEQLGLDYVEFPTHKISRTQPLGLFQLQCYAERVNYASPRKFIASRWSASGIAYSGCTESDNNAIMARTLSAVREASVPPAFMTVYVDTPREVASARLLDRYSGQGGETDRLESETIQQQAFRGYAWLIEQARSPHALDVFFVNGLDVAADVKDICAEYRYRVSEKLACRVS